MNKVNPRKLINSKWTAVTPIKKQKHFIVTQMKFDENGAVIRCVIEAVMTKSATPIDWSILKNTGHWQQGWK